MNTIIQKGIAGLGNRLMVLGWCLDNAIKYDTALWVDWRDSSWQTGFDAYFELSRVSLYEYISGKYWPDCWDIQTAQDVSCAKAMMPACKTAPHDIDAHHAECDVFVACQYLAPYSDAIFEHLHLTPYMQGWTSAYMQALPDNYHCYHIRHTDKRTKYIDDRLFDAAQYKFSVVVVTDSLQVKTKALELGLLCPSIIPADPKKGGVHHSKRATLAAQGLDRETLNRSAVADMFVAGLADRFIACCPDSSYSKFVQRGRKVGYFKKELSRC